MSIKIKGFIRASNEHDRESILKAAARKAENLRDIADTLDAIVKNGDVERVADSLTYSFADVTALRHEAAIVAEVTRLMSAKKVKRLPLAGIDPKVREIFEAETFRPVQDEPCKQCPFRRKSMPGWLGANSPEEFVQGIMYEAPLPCHSTINYRKQDWAEKWFARKIGKLCMGSRIFSANCAKKPRPGSLLPVVEANTELVFATPQEFLNHHRSLGRGSWELGESMPPKKNQPKSKPAPNLNASKVHDLVDDAVEEILQSIDEHDLSGSSHPKSTSREFWQGIIEGLRTRLSALASDDE